MKARCSAGVAVGGNEGAGVGSWRAKRVPPDVAEPLEAAAEAVAVFGGLSDPSCWHRVCAAVRVIASVASAGQREKNRRCDIGRMEMGGGWLRRTGGASKYVSH